MAGQTIDIEKILAKKFHGKTPRLMVWLIRRLLHEDYVNGYLSQGYEGVEFCENTIKYLNITLKVQGLENIPTDGRYTFVSNHPLGGVDGVALAGIIGRRFDGKIRMMVNEFLMHLEGLAPLCIPVHAKVKTKGSEIGNQNRDLPRLTNDIFASDNQILMFPAGLCSRKRGGVIKDLEWGKVCIKKSVEYQRDIVPVHFIGENSSRFYRVANLSKALHLKFNIAMAFLPDELYKAQGKTYRIIFGEPIPWETFDRSKTAKEWAQEMKDKVYELEWKAEEEK